MARRKSSLKMSAEQYGQIALSSRVRLARNLRGYMFPGRAKPVDLEAVFSVTSNALKELKFDVTRIDELEGFFDDVRLVEEHVISEDLLGTGDEGGAFGVKPGTGLSVLINEEDHVRIQSIEPGFCLDKCLQEALALDDLLSPKLDFAFSEELGYLTACPSNVGTGLRASVMVHLSGLHVMNWLKPSLAGISRLRLNVRGMLGENSEQVGQIYQISNRETLGVTEAAIVSRVSRLIDALILREHAARQILVTTERTRLKDAVIRALSVLLNAFHFWSCDEAVDLLYTVRLGVVLGVLKNITIEQIDGIILNTQSGHMPIVDGKFPKDKRGLDKHPAAVVVQEAFEKLGYYKGRLDTFFID